MGILKEELLRTKELMGVLSEQRTMRVNGIIVEKNGDVKLDASAMGLPRQTNIVGKPNIDKVVTAVEKGQREIKVKNKGGTEFTLTKV